MSAASAETPQQRPGEGFEVFGMQVKAHVVVKGLAAFVFRNQSPFSPYLVSNHVPHVTDAVERALRGLPQHFPEEGVQDRSRLPGMHRSRQESIDSAVMRR